MKLLHTFMIVFLSLCLFLPLAASDPFESGFEGPKIRKVVQKYEKSIVVVRYVLAGQIGSQDFERQFLCQGSIVDPSGVVMISGSHVQRVFRNGNQILHDFKPEYKDFEIIFDGETYNAQLIHKEMRENCAFLRIGPKEDETEIEEGRAFPSIPKVNRRPKISEPLLLIARNSEQQNYVPRILPFYVTSKAEVPQEFYGVNFVATDSLLGLPVFDLSGDVVGMVGYRTQLTASGQVQVYNPAGLLPLSDFDKIIKKVLNKESDEDQKDSDQSESDPVSPSSSKEEELF